VGLRVIEPFEKNGEMLGTIIKGNSGVICFQHTETDQTKFGLAITDLQGPDTKRAAQLEAAKRGISDPRLEFARPPYAVDINGDQILNPMVQKVAGYRIDVKINGRLV
jgi:hypothetical protein